MVEKFEKRIKYWVFRLISIGGILTLLKAILTGIPIYCISLSQVPKSILNILRIIMFNFLWSGKVEGNNIHMVNSEKNIYS